MAPPPISPLVDWYGRRRQLSPPERRRRPETPSPDSMSRFPSTRWHRPTHPLPAAVSRASSPPHAAEWNRFPRSTNGTAPSPSSAAAYSYSGYYGLGNESPEGTIELNICPMSAHFKNQKSFGHSVIIYVKRQALPSSEDKNTSDVPDRESFGAHGRTCILSRSYPKYAVGDDAHLFVFKSEIQVTKLNAWEMRSFNCPICYVWKIKSQINIAAKSCARMVWKPKSQIVSPVSDSRVHMFETELAADQNISDKVAGDLVFVRDGGADIQVEVEDMADPNCRWDYHRVPSGKALARPERNQARQIWPAGRAAGS